MEKIYEPLNFESRIYKNWLDKKYFSAKPNKNKKPFTIIMPPPNITGQLHMGHAMGCTIQDAIIRYKRMKGFEALWLPGTDHASIATEMKIVEQMKQENLKKEDVGREGFLKRAFDWNDKFGGRICEQLKKMGAGCDWDRLAFTMDKTRSKSVKTAFITLYNKGYIYRGSRIINWCPQCHTAISDAEVEYDPQNSYLWHIKYPIKDSEEFLTVATTRPETMLGDTAVAVNPKDKRYKKFVGKTLILPLMNREIPVIADEYVELEFGTGAVKITPAHDPNDYEVGIRHNLPIINIMNGDASINSEGGIYEGLSRIEARKKIVENLTKLGLLVKTEKHTHNVCTCHRCGETIESLVSKQWFVRMKELSKPAIEIVKNKEISFQPKRFEKMYMHWMENTKDWCISRQLWWGHRIPVFYCDACGKEYVSHEEEMNCPACGKIMRRDEDVLDTWFSSALWPFSTLGWPNENEDLAYFYPTATMETAYDIIGFWVSRMIFTGLEFMKEKPFDKVLIHGIVKDAIGRKMSKSLNNGVDPLEVIEKYGADTLRMSLISGVGIGNDVKYSDEKQESYRNFMNKLWNASRFVIMNSENIKHIPINRINLSLEDKWILGKLNDAINLITKLMDKNEIGLASSYLYEFVWNNYCDWYIEFTKPALYSGDENIKSEKINVLTHVLREILKLLHPIVPFITAEIYSKLEGNDAEDIMISSYPVYSSKKGYKEEVKKIDSVIEIIKSIRNLRSEMNVSQSKRTAIYIKQKEGQGLNHCCKIIEKLACGSEIHFVSAAPEIKTAKIIAESAEIYLPMNELIDYAQEVARLTKELEKTESEIARAKSKLENSGFVSKAPPSLIEEEKAKIQKFIDIKNKLEESIAALK